MSSSESFRDFCKHAVRLLANAVTVLFVCVVGFLPFVLSGVVLYLISYLIQIDLQNQRITPVCTDCDDILYHFWMYGEKNCLGRRYSYVNNATSKPKNVIVLTQTEPPNECRVKTFTYRNNVDIELVLLGNRDMELCEGAFFWEVYLCGGSDANITKIYSDIPVKNIHTFECHSSTTVNVSKQNITLDEWFDPTNFDKATLLARQFQRYTQWTFMDYCNQCSEMNITNKWDICEYPDEILERTNFVFGLLCCIPLTLIFCCLCYTPGIMLYYLVGCKFRDRGTNSERSPLIDALGKKNKIINYTKVEIGIQIPDEFPEEFFEDPGRDFGHKNPDWKEEFCVVCVQRKRMGMVLDCGHLCLCIQCSRKMLVEGEEKNKKCPICKKKIKDGIKRVYF